MTAWSIRKLPPEPATPPNSARIVPVTITPRHFDVAVDDNFLHVMTKVGNCG